MPIGLSEGCVLRRDVAKDAVVSFDDVMMPAEWSKSKHCGGNRIARWPHMSRGAEDGAAARASRRKSVA